MQKGFKSSGVDPEVKSATNTCLSKISLSAAKLFITDTFTQKSPAELNQQGFSGFYKT
jgi:hypothetical protein